ncbi:MAG: flagellar biosynthetic protein FliQ [Actinomycetota bacterium]
MSDTVVIDIVRDALALAAALAGPALVLSLAIGVSVSLIQTVTQIQDATLTFVPKLIGGAVLLLVMGAWMLERFTSYVTELWGSIPTLV